MHHEDSKADGKNSLEADREVDWKANWVKIIPIVKKAMHKLRKHQKAQFSQINLKMEI
jgi:hypothetical protein